jgi:hypothetical protein
MKGATRLKLLPHPAHRRDTETKERRNFIGAFALFVEVDDSFANGQRNGAHDSTLPPRAQFVKLHVLWKCSKRGDDMEIANTKSPALYRTEHFGMTAFSYPVPNGTYIVKLHFAETFDGITGAGQRVFSFNIEGTAIQRFRRVR